MTDLVTRIAQNWTDPTATALQSGDTKLSFADLDRKTRQIAVALENMQIGPGDRVAIALPKSAAGFVLFLGILRNGSVAVVLNANLPRDVLTRMVTASDAKLFLHDPDFDPLPDLPCPSATLSKDNGGSFGASLDTADPDSHVAPQLPDKAPALILFTSGTTGNPKGVLHSVKGIFDNMKALRQNWDLTVDDTLLHVLPISHAHGLVIAPLPVLIGGGRILWLDEFEPRRTLAHLPDATCFMGVPFHYRQLLDSRAFDKQALGSIRLFVSGSAPLGDALAQEFADRSGRQIVQRYAMTETMIITVNPHDAVRPGSVGRVLQGLAARIVDPATRAPLPGGEIGELEISGPSVFLEYINAPQANAESKTADGFFKTGDLGYLDDDGYLHLRGRARDVVIYCGMNVYPSDVESAIDTLDGVAEACVFGIPQPQTGEAVMAAVVARPDVKLDPALLRRDLIGKLAPYQLPKRILLIDAIPRNAMGKPDRKALVARYSG